MKISKLWFMTQMKFCVLPQIVLFICYSMGITLFCGWLHYSVCDYTILWVIAVFYGNYTILWELHYSMGVYTILWVIALFYGNNTILWVITLFYGNYTILWVITLFYGWLRYSMVITLFYGWIHYSMSKTFLHVLYLIDNFAILNIVKLHI